MNRQRAYISEYRHVVLPVIVGLATLFGLRLIMVNPKKHHFVIIAKPRIEREPAWLNKIIDNIIKKQCCQRFFLKRRVIVVVALLTTVLVTILLSYHQTSHDLPQYLHQVNEPLSTLPTETAGGLLSTLPTEAAGGPLSTLPTETAGGPLSTLPTETAGGLLSTLPTETAGGPLSTLPTETAGGTLPPSYTVHKNHTDLSAPPENGTSPIASINASTARENGSLKAISTHDLFLRVITFWSYQFYKVSAAIGHVMPSFFSLPYDYFRKR